MLVYMHTISRTENRKDKIIENKPKNIYKFFKVIIEDIDYDYLHNFVDSLNKS